MSDSYKDFSKVYDDCGINEYSLTVGRSILKFFNEKHPDETFNKNLDLCCGTGTLCKFFYDNKINTKGVDISNNMLNIAREKYPEIEFICEDASKFNEDKDYDFITCIDDAMNHIIGKELFENIIKNASNLLRNGGYFIFDLIDFNKFELNEEITKSLSENTKLVYYISQASEDITYTDVQYYIDDELTWETRVVEQMYPKEYVKEVLKNAGFDVELCTPNFYEDTRQLKCKYIARKI